jgi:hypothetical protein
VEQEGAPRARQGRLRRGAARERRRSPGTTRSGAPSCSST